MEATTKKKNFSFWSIVFVWLIFSDSSSSTKNSSDRAREFLVGRWTYFEPLAKQGEKRNILTLSTDGTCTVGKQKGSWNYSDGYAAIAIGPNSSFHYYELDSSEGSLTDHAPKGKTLTKIK